MLGIYNRREDFGNRDFIAKVDKDLQSTFRVEIYGDLDVLESVKMACSKLHIVKKLVLTVILDCLNMLRRIDLTNRVIIILTSVHEVIRKILRNKKDFFSSLYVVKAVAHQD